MGAYRITFFGTIWYMSYRVITSIGREPSLTDLVRQFTTQSTEHSTSGSFDAHSSFDLPKSGRRAS